MSIYLITALNLVNGMGLRGSRVLLALFAIKLGAGAFEIGMLIALSSVVQLLLGVYAALSTTTPWIETDETSAASFAAQATIARALSAIPAITPLLSMVYSSGLDGSRRPRMRPPTDAFM